MPNPVSEILSEIANEQALPPTTESTSEGIDWHTHALRSHSAEVIQRAFAKVLSDLPGKDFQTHSKHIEYAPDWAGGSAGMLEYAEIVLRVTPPR
jgi:hypothetical protein